MKQNECRIGNLVMFDGRVFAIDSIAKEFPTLDTIEFGIGVVDWNNIQPIELTEEWLVKLGFEISNFKDGCYYLNGRLLMPKNGYYFDYGSNTDIKYLHQLQNFYFALTGTELKLT